MMAENLIQRLEAFMGKSAVLYEKRAMLNYRLNRLTLALFDIESALSLDPEHSDAIYLKGLIFLREEDFRDAIEAIVQAHAIHPHYMGMGFFLAVDDSVRSGMIKADSKIAFEPNDDLIKLLHAGIKREFDKLHGFLMSVVEKTTEAAKKNDVIPAGHPAAEASGEPAAQGTEAQKRHSRK
jgi:tetratricopeptide (TPR) repeat protein